MTTRPTSIDNKTTKVTRLKEDRFCVFFCLGFVCGGSFFYTFINLRKFHISKNLVIIFKLSTIKSFYYIEKDFAIILVFLGSYRNYKAITKEKE
jgi:hypothetical protein